ncbi:MAG: phosphoribosylglycinamide formyltransferase [Pirellulales bacterium]|nr:phosphoribosylglycinamide formyltransferase [Pirellulales bacterium]
MSGTANTYSPLRLAVLISGGGTTLANLLAKIDECALDAEVRLVITSNPAARGIDIALRAGIPVEIIERSEYRDLADFSRANFDPIRKAGVDLVAMGGYLKLVPIPDDFAGRVMNIHPSLIPAFCGKGFYGHHVHEAVLEYGAKVSGCTVHFVDNQYDHGPIVLQRTVPVEAGDTPDDLAARVFAAECEAYPAALQLFAAGRLRIDGRVVHVAPE